MCGIFGIIKRNDSDIPAREFSKIFTDLFILSESRGKEASGFALNNGKEIKVFKAPFPACETIKTGIYQNAVSDLFSKSNKLACAIGHSRLVTNGYEQFNHNNQPVVKNNMVGIHNGIIVNEAELWGKYKEEQRTSDLDSELIPTIIHHSLQKNNSLKEAVKGLYSQIYGMTSIAFLFAGYNNLLLATNNGSLYYMLSQDKNAFVFASERHILLTLINKSPLKGNFKTSDITQLKPQQMAFVDIANNKLESEPINKKSVTFDFATISTLKDNLVINDISEKNANKPVFINTSLNHLNVKVPKAFVDHFKKCENKIGTLKRCTKCLLPETFPYIKYDDEGVCNFCLNYKKLEFQGKEKFNEILESVRSKDGSPDCLLPFSGGRDSSFALHYVKKELGMNPIAFSYDWGMLTDLARRNQARMCGKLGVEHILISADIRKKRTNIHKNVNAWLKHPNLGTIPLFMAGDKQYFYYSNLLMEQNNLKLSILGENMLETTNFKSGFCGIKPKFGEGHTYSLSTLDKLKMMAFYGKEYLRNPAYINSSMLDTLDAFKSYYVIKHQNINIFNYLQWDEKLINDTLSIEYEWEIDPETSTTWRIGDGTAAFYNYIYYIVAGFTENDTFRSNQIREGTLTRDKAMDLSKNENMPRWNSIHWYCNTININFEETIKIVNTIKPLYDKI